MYIHKYSTMVHTFKHVMPTWVKCEYIYIYNRVGDGNMYSKGDKTKSLLVQLYDSIIFIL